MLRVYAEERVIRAFIDIAQPVGKFANVFMETLSTSFSYIIGFIYIYMFVAIDYNLFEFCWKNEAEAEAQ